MLTQNEAVDCNIKRKHKYVYVIFAALQLYVVVSSQLVIIVYTSNILIVQDKWLGRFEGNN